MIRWSPALALVAGLCTLGCDPDNCADLQPSFHLDVEVEEEDGPIVIALLRVDVLRADEEGDRRRRFFEIGDELGDNKTSIGIELDPAPTEPIDVTVTVAAYATTSTSGQPLQEVTDTFEVGPDGCNRFRVNLEFE